LLNGLESPHTLLNKFIEAHTTCRPGDAGEEFLSWEPELRMNLDVRGFDWDRLQSGTFVPQLEFSLFLCNSDPSALENAAMIVQSHLTRSAAPTLGLVTVRLVEYGIARLRDKHHGQIIEPLAFVSLMKWLETQERDNILSNIRKRSGFQDSRAVAYEELVVLYLLRTMRYPIPLSTIFNFHGTAPVWADAFAQIVGRREGIDVPVDVLGGAPENPGLSAVHFTANPEEITHWVESPDTAPPILLATHLFSTDIMVRLKVYWPMLPKPAIEVLALAQCKSYTSGNIETLDAETLTKAVNSLNDDHWLKRMKVYDPNRRQKVIDAFGNHHTLRFVCGYPLVPDLNSGAASVKQAISALGTNVSLATLDLHSFEAEFITDDEYRDVLTPMKHALSNKRKADKMDD
jgi:hypothetical protein